MSDDDVPTPKQTGSSDRGLALSALAVELAIALDTVANTAAKPGPLWDLEGGMAASRLATRARKLADNFTHWGLATREQRFADMKDWNELLDEAVARCGVKLYQGPKTP